jgi:Tfp pilus assembly protein PilP
MHFYEKETYTKKQRKEFFRQRDDYLKKKEEKEKKLIEEKKKKEAYIRKYSLKVFLLFNLTRNNGFCSIIIKKKLRF